MITLRTSLPLLFAVAFGALLGACSAPPPSAPPVMTEAVAAPRTPAPATATPDVVATSEAAATLLAEEEAAAADEQAAADAAEANAGAADLPAEITNNLWLLQEYAGANGAMQPALASHDITATWADSTISGQTGCNEYRGAYVRQPDGTITVQQLALSAEGMGNLGCEADSAEINQQGYYLDALGKSAVYQVEQPGQLKLSDAAGNLLLVFVTQR